MAARPAGLVRVLLRHPTGSLVAGAAAPDGYVVEEDAGAPRPDDTPAQLWACVPPMETAEADQSLASALSMGAHGIVLVDTVGLVDLEWAGSRLAVLEAEHERADGAIRILAALDGPAGMTALPSLRSAPSARLAGLLLRPDRLAATLACDRDAAPMAWARAQVVIAAAMASVPALLDGPSDEPALRAARRDGFAGAVLTDPALVGSARTIFGSDD